MIKKLTLLAMAVGALVAFAVPSMASAAVTNSLGEAAETVDAVSENTVSVTNGGTLDCDTVELNLSLTPETTAHYTGSGTAEGTTGSHEGACEITQNKTPVTVTSINATVNLNGGGTGTASFSYSILVGHAVPCVIDGTANVTYTPGSDVITLKEGKLTGTSTSPCPTAGTISGDFKVTSGGEAVEID